MTDPVEMASLNARVDEAIAGISDLRRSVESMTHATTVLTQVQKDQIEIKAKAEAAEAKAEKVARATVVRTEKTRAGFRRVALAFIVLIALFAAGIAASNNAAANRANEAAQHAAATAKQLINDANSERIPACNSRNAGTQVQIDRERALAALPEISAAEARVHARSANLLERLLFDCSVYKPIP